MYFFAVCAESVDASAAGTFPGIVPGVRRFGRRIRRGGNCRGLRHGVAVGKVHPARIRRDGSIESARVLRSSGVPLLDDTALRIVRLAAPFPPLPRTQEKVDVLQVTRTWMFLADGRLRDVPQP